MTLDDYPVDDDYIGVEEQAAEVSQSDEYRYDGSHTYDRSDIGMAGTARDVEIDRRDVTDRDDRGGTRTGFNSNEANEGVLSKIVIRDGSVWKYADWLRLLQIGYRDKTRKAENENFDTQSYMEMFTSRLDMTTYQDERVRKIINSIDMSNMAHYPKEVVVLAVISIVANEDDRWIRDERTYKDLVTDLDSSMEDIKNTRRLVKEKSHVV